MPIALLGLAITIYAIISRDLDTYVSLSYVFVVMIWLTIVIERWKRKASEISLKWGLTMIKSEEKEIREGFFGDDRYNFRTQVVDWQADKIKQVITSIISLPIVVGLLLITVSCYIATLWFKQTGSLWYFTFLAGIGNSIVINIINFIYVKLIYYFTTKIENHKYWSSLEES